MIEILQWMLEELENQRLEVCKVPSRIEGYRRCVMSRNCEWYQTFCNSYTRRRRKKKWRKIRTFIKRQTTINALKRMMKGDRTTVYAQRILDLIPNLEISQNGRSLSGYDG